MGKNNLSFLIVSIILIVILIFCLVYFILRILKTHPKKIEVEPEFLSSILKVGNYTGESRCTPTDIYKNGLKCTHNLKFYKINKGIEFENLITAYDLKTNKKEFTLKRTGLYFYKSNHGKTLFRKTTSFINDKIVSCLYGYAINQNKKKKRITFLLNGGWHVSKNVYQHINGVIERTDEDTLKLVFKHYNILGLPVFSMREEYTQQ